MDTMTTVSQVLNQLRKDGYTKDFNLDDNCIICHENSLKLYPEDFVVDRHYRFEGQSDPADEAGVYAISSRAGDVKGTLVNGFGIYSDPATDSLIKALQPRSDGNGRSFLAGLPVFVKEIDSLLRHGCGML